MAREEVEERAWHIHTALLDWTGKVDQKASFVLTLETAIAVAALAGLADGRLLKILSTWQLICYLSGLLIVCCSVVLSLLSIRPRLASEIPEDRFGEHFIYFGHIAPRTRAQISASLHSVDVMPALANQLKEMSVIAKRKHKRVRLSIDLLLVGICLMAAALLYRAGVAVLS